SISSLSESQRRDCSASWGLDVTPHNLHQLAGTLAHGVVFEHPRAGCLAHPAAFGIVAEQIAVAVYGFFLRMHDKDFLLRLEPQFQPVIRIGDDASAHAAQFKRTRRR